jgi:hypothetical protein
MSLLPLETAGCWSRETYVLHVVLAATSEQSSSKSATIEMYAPSSYNETVTGETLSSVSEKSESYSNGDSNQEYLVSWINWHVCILKVYRELFEAGQ